MVASTLHVQKLRTWTSTLRYVCLNTMHADNTTCLAVAGSLVLNCFTYWKNRKANTGIMYKCWSKINTGRVLSSCRHKWYEFLLLHILIEQTKQNGYITRSDQNTPKRDPRPHKSKHAVVWANTDSLIHWPSMSLTNMTLTRPIIFQYQ